MGNGSDHRQVSAARCIAEAAGDEGFVAGRHHCIYIYIHIYILPNNR